MIKTIYSSIKRKNSSINEQKNYFQINQKDSSNSSNEQLFLAII